MASQSPDRPERSEGPRRLELVMGGLLLALAASCQTPQVSEPAAVDPTVQAKTILPPAFDKTPIDVAAGHELLIPAEMLLVAEVIRPRAEMRDGPGTHFPLADRMLTSGTRVIPFERLGVWQRVVILETGQRGWVHHKTLSEPRVNREIVRVKAADLPTVLAMNPIKAVYSYPARTPLAVTIPKGSIFRSLVKSDFGTLVWLPETNSVMWMAGKDVQ